MPHLCTVDSERERLSLVLTSTRLGLWDWNMQSGDVVIDERWAAIVGYDLDDLQPVSIDTWTRLTHPDDLDRSNGLIEAHDSGELPYYDVEVRMQHQAGHWVWVHDRGKIVEWSADGRPLRMTGTHEDISDRVRAREEIAASERRFRAMFTDHDAVMLLVDPDTGEIVDANIAAAAFYGYSVDELRSMVIGQINMLRGDEVAHDRHMAEHRAPGYFVFPHRLASGEVRTVDVHSSPLDDRGRTLLFSIIRDVTEAERRESDLRRAARAFASTSEAAMLTDREGYITSVNRAFTTVTGWESEAIVGRHASSLTSIVQGSPDDERITSTQQSGQSLAEQLDIIRSDGSRFPALISISPVSDLDGRSSGTVVLISDLSSRIAAENARLDRLAHFDMLTGLPNRVSFTLTLHSRMEEGPVSPGTLVMIDLDRFQTVNDSFGHWAGDEVLAIIGARLSARLGPRDVLARFGGDEFAILLDGSGPADGTIASLLEALTAPCGLSTGVELFTSGSAGVATLDQGDTVEALLQGADAALHLAKRQGPSSTQRHSPAIVAVARDLLSMQSRLRHGWADRQFVVAYQPQLEVATGRIVGAEALLRWPSPEGPVPPDAFIPVAESTGLISPMGRWVVEEVCRQGRSWADAGLPDLTLAVNVSAHQFGRGDLADAVLTALDDSGFPGHRLKLEITESALLATSVDARSELAKMTEAGVRWAIDDFGTGYSSFAYLRHFWVDQLKLDRSFIMHVHDNADDRSIVAAMITLGHSLGMQVIAEGVENHEQLTAIGELGCDSYQGYLVSPAVTPAEFAVLVQRHGQP